MMVLLKRWLQAARDATSGKRHFSRAAREKIRRLRIAMLTPNTRTLNTRWLKRRGIDLLGWPGVVAIGLLSICPAFYFSAILPAQEKLASTRHSVLALQERMNNAGTGENADQRTPEEQLADIYRMFPDGSDLPASLEKIFALAQSQGIGLDKGEYQVTRNNKGKLVSFQVMLPVKGEYTQIRKYIDALRADIPVLSLQQVQFKRQKIGDRVVEANIKLALYLLEQRS